MSQPSARLVPDRPWKAEERHVARLLVGARYPANSGGRADVEGPGVLAQVKHVRTCSLANLEALAVEMDTIGRQRGKVGLVVVKRRAGRGQQTPRLIVLTESSFRGISGAIPTIPELSGRGPMSVTHSDSNPPKEY